MGARGCGDRASADPVVRATVETTTPDPAALVALDAALVAYGSDAAPGCG